MASAEELLSGLAASDTATYCTVSNATRRISIPNTASILGVENDKNMKRVYFLVERYYCGHDLSEFEPRINYTNAGGGEGIGTVSDMAVSDDGEYITFSWLAAEKATQYAGDTKFVLCFRKLVSDGVYQEFNTTVAGMTVLVGLEPSSGTEVTLDDDAKAILADSDVVAYLESASENVCLVDFDTREISFNNKVLGVENDKRVHVILFQMPRYYEGTDLSEFDIRVNFENANGYKGANAVLPVSTGDATITFAWLVDLAVTSHAGTVRFSVCLRKSGAELNTTPASATVLEGMEPSDETSDEGSEGGAESAVLGVAVLGAMVLGSGTELERLETPVISLVADSLPKLDAPVIQLVVDEEEELPKLATPAITLETVTDSDEGEDSEEEELPVLSAPVIELEGA